VLLAYPRELGEEGGAVEVVVNLLADFFAAFFVRIKKAGGPEWPPDVVGAA